MLATACLAASGCTGPNSEDGHLHVSLRPLFYSAVHQPSGLRALLGSKVCFDAGIPASDDTWFEGIEACYDMAIAGVPIADGDCVILDQPSGVRIDYTPRADCPFDEAEFELLPDRFRVEGVPVDGLRARLEWHMEHWAEHLAERLSSRPADLIPGADEPLRLVPDVLVGFPINVIDAAGERVGWDLSQGRVLEAKGGDPARTLAPIEDTDALWPVRVGAGEQSTLTLEVAGAVLPVATVVATPVEQAASLEIVAAVGDEPFGARAIVRDGEGRVILGAPVEWSLVEGELALMPVDDFTPPEYTIVADDCVPPPTAAESRRAVLRARLGELSDELEIEWTAMPPEEVRDEPFSPNPACQRGTGPAGDDGLGDRGCNCASTAGAGGGSGAWLAALALMLGARRRRSGG
ncbi:MYXO-CTERM sorting domain-containing protein [Nannocystis pusilla]|uniref:MYXO-CTERM sorting domain-containing protein n=1 Tax=Nannocystis pusilla TaxID=889268 RepID=UPI001CCA4EB0|nr:MYXO-CTERM sorting domain-containing protein [Nannocystis pusilla]